MKVSQPAGQPMPHGVQLLPAQRDLLLKVVSEAALKYRHQIDIQREVERLAPELPKVSRQTIIRYRKKAQLNWQKHAAEAIGIQKAAELNHLIMLREEAMRAYQRTVGPVKTVTQEGAPRVDPATGAIMKAPDGSPIIDKPHVTHKTEIQAGSPEWARVLIDIDKQIRTLMGMDEAAKLDFGLHGPGGGPIETKTDGLSFADFARVFASIATGRPDTGSLENPTGHGDSKPLDSMGAEGKGFSVDQASPVPDVAL